MVTITNRLSEKNRGGQKREEPGLSAGLSGGGPGRSAYVESPLVGLCVPCFGMHASPAAFRSFGVAMMA